MTTSNEKPNQSTVLIVEDEWIVARDMQQTLQADGHIVPPRFLRHSPTPAHNSTARVRPPSAPKSNVVGTSGVT